MENIPAKARIELAEAVADVILGKKTPNVSTYLQRESGSFSYNREVIAAATRQ